MVFGPLPGPAAGLRALRRASRAQPPGSPSSEFTPSLPGSGMTEAPPTESGELRFIMIGRLKNIGSKLMFVSDVGGEWNVTNLWILPSRSTLLTYRLEVQIEGKTATFPLAQPSPSSISGVQPEGAEAEPRRSRGAVPLSGFPGLKKGLSASDKMCMTVRRIISLQWDTLTPDKVIRHASHLLPKGEREKESVHFREKHLARLWDKRRTNNMRVVTKEAVAEAVYSSSRMKKLVQEVVLEGAFMNVAAMVARSLLLCIIPQFVEAPFNEDVMSDLEAVKNTVLSSPFSLVSPHCLEKATTAFGDIGDAAMAAMAKMVVKEKQWMLQVNPAHRSGRGSPLSGRGSPVTSRSRSGTSDSETGTAKLGPQYRSFSYPTAETMFRIALKITAVDYTFLWSDDSDTPEAPYWATLKFSDVIVYSAASILLKMERKFLLSGETLVDFHRDTLDDWSMFNLPDSTSSVISQVSGVTVDKSVALDTAVISLIKSNHAVSYRSYKTVALASFGDVESKFWESLKTFSVRNKSCDLTLLDYSMVSTAAFHSFIAHKVKQYNNSTKDTRFSDASISSADDPLTTSSGSWGRSRGLVALSENSPVDAESEKTPACMMIVLPKNMRDTLKFDNESLSRKIMKVVMDGGFEQGCIIGTVGDYQKQPSEVLKGIRVVFVLQLSRWTVEELTTLLMIKKINHVANLVLSDDWFGSQSQLQIAVKHHAQRGHDGHSMPGETSSGVPARLVFDVLMRHSVRLSCCFNYLSINVGFLHAAVEFVKGSTTDSVPRRSSTKYNSPLNAVVTGDGINPMPYRPSQDYSESHYYEQVLASTLSRRVYQLQRMLRTVSITQDTMMLEHFIVGLPRWTSAHAKDDVSESRPADRMMLPTDLLSLATQGLEDDGLMLRGNDVDKVIHDCRKFTDDRDLSLSIFVSDHSPRLQQFQELMHKNFSERRRLLRPGKYAYSKIHQAYVMIQSHEGGDLMKIDPITGEPELRVYRVIHVDEDADTGLARPLSVTWDGGNELERKAERKHKRRSSMAQTVGGVYGRITTAEVVENQLMPALYVPLSALHKIPPADLVIACFEETCEHINEDQDCSKGGMCVIDSKTVDQLVLKSSRLVVLAGSDGVIKRSLCHSDRMRSALEHICLKAYSTFRIDENAEEPNRFKKCRVELLNSNDSVEPFFYEGDEKLAELSRRVQQALDKACDEGVVFDGTLQPQNFKSLMTILPSIKKLKAVKRNDSSSNLLASSVKDAALSKPFGTAKQQPPLGALRVPGEGGPPLIPSRAETEMPGSSTKGRRPSQTAWGDGKVKGMAKLPMGGSQRRKSMSVSPQRPTPIQKTESSSSVATEPKLTEAEADFFNLTMGSGKDSQPGGFVFRRKLRM